MVKCDLGSRFISRAAKTESQVPRSFFAPKPNGNACYAGYILPRQIRPVVVVGRLGTGRKQSTRGTMGRGKKGGESEQPLLLIKNYLNLQYNINNALSHNCYECFHLPNAIGGTNTKLLA